MENNDQNKLARRHLLTTMSVAAVAGLAASAGPAPAQAQSQPQAQTPRQGCMAERAAGQSSGFH